MDNPQVIIEQTKQEQLRLKSIAHEQWLKHPTTKEMLSGLGYYEERLLTNTTASAERVLAAMLAIRATHQWISNTENFIKFTNPE